MPEFVDDPSLLTKDKLKSELLAHNVELPSGNHTKDVYVQLYLKNLTAQNKNHAAAATLDAFSSDEELPPPVVSNRSRSSGKKAPRKTDKVLPIVLDVTTLTDEVLRDELLKHGVHAGPIVASTRQLYEKKLQKFLDEGPAQATITKIVVTEIQVNHNGNSESELYSDKEDDVIAEPEPEPVPVVERPVRSRGKTPVTARTRSNQHKIEDCGSPDDLTYERRSQKITNLSTCSPEKKHSSASPLSNKMLVSQVEKIAAGDETPKVDKKVVLKELYPNDISSPLGISATCRRPIRGAAGRPVTSIDLWNDENTYFSPKNARSMSNSASSSYIESRIINRVRSPQTSSSSSCFNPLPSTTKVLSAKTPAGPNKVSRQGMSWWKKVLLMAIGAAFLFLVYQAMETNTINPFSADNSQVVSGSKA